MSKVEVNKDRLVISFDHAPHGLIAKIKSLPDSIFPGAKDEWLPAEAKIDNDKIIVWNKSLKQPLYVRYGFGNTIVGNVFGKDGLPLTPFRTDDWPPINHGQRIKCYQFFNDEHWNFSVVSQCKIRNVLM